MARLNGDVYGVRGLDKPLLLRLDELLSGGAGATYDHATVSVEHVLPQTPPQDSQWCSDFSKTERELWTHKLANLVLLSRRKNAKASNYPFEDKKEKYFTSKDGVSVYALTTQVLSTATWTPRILEQRQTDLVAKLAKEWDLA